MSGSQIELLTSIERWIDAEPNIESAVLFGSTVRSDATFCDRWADIDLHVITHDPNYIETIDWKSVVRPQTYLFRSTRPASGGVQKITVLFSIGQLDLVLVPTNAMATVEAAMNSDLHKGRGHVREALNEMATCLASGFRFLKGEEKWGALYRRVATEMPGVRLDDTSLRALAAIFICDAAWILKKLERGELVAAQHLLHRSLSETNLRLLRELRLRKGLPLPSFGLGRRVEILLNQSELREIVVSARLDKEELREATGSAFGCLKKLMSELVRDWELPVEVNNLLDSPCD